MATYKQNLRSWLDGSLVPDITPEEGRRMWTDLYGEGAPYEMEIKVDDVRDLALETSDLP